MKNLFIILLSGFVLNSCDSIVEKKAPKDEIVKKEEIKPDEHHDSDKVETIALNNGEKWVVNEEMKPNVLKGEETLNQYAQNNQTDFKKLAAELKVQNNKLIKSCTMKGTSHDELHKWLNPHLELTKELGEEKDATGAKKIVTELQASYKKYHEYFN